MGHDGFLDRRGPDRFRSVQWRAGSGMRRGSHSKSRISRLYVDTVYIWGVDSGNIFLAPPCQPSRTPPLPIIQAARNACASAARPPTAGGWRPEQGREGGRGGGRGRSRGGQVQEKKK